MSNMTNDQSNSVYCYIDINCFTFLSGRQEIDERHLFAAATFGFTLVPIVALTNVLLLIHLRKKQNVPPRFHRLLQILCVADIFVGTVALPSYATALLLSPSGCNCPLELTAQFTSAMFGGTSGRTTVVIAFHQSTHIKKLTISPFIHNKQYRILIYGLGCAVSLITATSVTIATFNGIYQHVAGAFTLLDFAFLVAVIFLYISAYRTVKKHVVTREIRTSRKLIYDQLFAKKITRIITVLVVCYGPFIATNFVDTFFFNAHPNKWLKLVNIWSYNIVFANSFLNALILLCNDGVFHKLRVQYDDALPFKTTRTRNSSKPSRSNNVPMQRLDIKNLGFATDNTRQF